MDQLELYFNEIKSHPDRLEVFCEELPKGADIHHHALGAIWAEDVLELAAELGLWVNLQTGMLHAAPAKASYKVREILYQDAARNQLIDHWSVRNFDPARADAHLHFFDIFPKLEAVFIDQEPYWLKKISTQAAKENLLYIETLIEVPNCRTQVCNWALQYEGEISEEESALQGLYDHLMNMGLEQLAGQYGQTISAWEAERAAIVTPAARMGYQLYAIRTLSPVEVLAQLMLCFKAAQYSEHIVGVNLVAPEHHPNSIQYYRLHMAVCAWLKARFPSVNLALHAGELTAELVEEAELKFHIEAAVAAGAQRIGHGVDILQETAYRATLTKMAERGIALEVLLDSNDFILNVKGEAHPILSYHKTTVPLIIATDDPALLRCDLSEQFYRLIQNYPSLSYQDIKQMVVNSIQYSFLNSNTKNQLLVELKQQFAEFEVNLP